MRLDECQFSLECTHREYIPVKTQDFSENKNENHADKDAGLLHVCPDAGIANNANAVAGSEARQSNSQAAGKVHKTTVNVSSYTASVKDSTHVKRL